MEDEIVEYFIVNSELNMSAGKVCAQIGHVATIIAVDYCDQDIFWKWYQKDQKKSKSTLDNICLHLHLNLLLKYKDLY